MLQNEYLSTPIYKKIIVIIVSLIILAMQVAIFYFSFIGSIYNEKYTYTRILYFVGLILGFIVCLLVINFEKNASYKVTWIALISLLPLFFSFLYMLNFFARRFPKRKQSRLLDYVDTNNLVKYNDYSELTSEERRISKMIYSQGRETIYNNTKVEFFNDAILKHKHMIETLKKAKKYIFLEYFIISDGQLMDELIEVLNEKGNEGVEIKLLYDDMGSKRCLSKKLISKLVSIPNLKLCVFQPLGFNLNPLLNYRDHRKIVVVDGLYAYCGGDNLADEYIHLKQRFGYWRDNACYYEGEAVDGFISMFSTMWFMSSKETLDLRNYIVKHNVVNDTYVIPISDGPNNNEDIAYNAFASMFNVANETLYISTPYLIIDDNLLEDIINAKKSGVDVKILTPGIPDKKMVFSVTRAHYKTLLEAGVEVYEYTKGFNHAKNIIVDNKMAFCGTVNMDYRSMFLHYECGGIIFRDKVIREMKEDFLKDIKESKLVTIDDYKKRSPFSKLSAFLLRVFSPML